MSYQIILFLVAIFLIRLPPIYYLGIKNTFLTTHIISIIVFINLFILAIWKAIKNKVKIIEFNIESVLILLFFLTQSLSMISTQNVLIFIQRYSKLLLGLVVCLVFYFINKKQIFKPLLKILLLGGFISIAIQLLLLIFPNLYFDLGNIFIYGNVLDITKANYSVGKLFDDSYLELIIPILVYYLLKEKKPYSKFLIFFVIFVCGFLTIVSNFRYRLLTFIFSFCLSFFLLKIKEKNAINKVFGLFIIIFFILTTLNPFIQRFFSRTSIDRLIEKEEFEDSSSISWRLKMFGKSIELAQTNLFGVGLGNMFDYLPKKELKSITVNTQIPLGALSAGPHNIFFQFLSDTGFIGLFSFLLLLSYYVKKDFSIIKENRKKEKVTFIAMFWTLIFIVQFFPAINLTFYTLFFILRGMI